MCWHLSSFTQLYNSFQGKICFSFQINKKPGVLLVLYGEFWLTKYFRTESNATMWKLFNFYKWTHELNDKFIRDYNCMTIITTLLCVKIWLNVKIQSYKYRKTVHNNGIISFRMLKCLEFSKCVNSNKSLYIISILSRKHSAKSGVNTIISLRIVQLV